jgi:hypothetical protein
MSVNNERPTLFINLSEHEVCIVSNHDRVESNRHPSGRPRGHRYMDNVFRDPPRHDETSPFPFQHRVLFSLPEEAVELLPEKWY